MTYAPELLSKTMLDGAPGSNDAVAVAMIDRLVHHAEILSLKGDSYRLKDRDLGRTPRPNTPDA
jgi:DNA replication protein DnaC